MVTARSESKAKDFAQSRSRFKDLLEVVVTGDLSAIGAFDDLAKDVDVIVHCASVSLILISPDLLRANCSGLVERVPSIHGRSTVIWAHRTPIYRRFPPR